jgi:hypothetical protein
MRQSIENKKTTRLFEASITVMFHGSLLFLGSNNSFFASANAVPALARDLAVVPAVVPDGIWLSRLIKLRPDIKMWRRRTPPRSLPRIEQSSAEGLIARSALAVFAANPRKRSHHAASSAITTMTEQRRCEAA